MHLQAVPAQRRIAAKNIDSQPFRFRVRAYQSTCHSWRTLAFRLVDGAS